MIKSRKNKLENRIRDILNRKKPTVEDVLEAVEDYERNNLKTIEKLKKKKSLEVKKINGALKQTINAHGDIRANVFGFVKKILTFFLILFA